VANEYYAVQLGFVSAGNFALCELHYRIVNPTEPNEWRVAQQLIEEIIGSPSPSTWLADLLACMSQDAFVSSVRARRVAPGGGNTAVQSFEPSDFPGTNASNIEAVQTASCVIWIPTVSPSKTGRTFIPGVGEDMLAQSRWDAGQIVAIDAFVATHIVGFSIAAGTMLPVVYDRLTSTGDVISDGYLSPKIGTIRKRELPV